MLVCFCLRWRILPVALRLRYWLLDCRCWSVAWFLVLLVQFRRRMACLLLVRQVWRQLAWRLRLRLLMRRFLAPRFRKRFRSRLSPCSSLLPSRHPLNRAVLSRLAPVLPRWRARPLALHLWHGPCRPLHLRLVLPWRVTPLQHLMLRRLRMPRLLLQLMPLRRVPPPRL